MKTTSSCKCFVIKALLGYKQILLIERVFNMKQTHELLTLY